MKIQTKKQTIIARDVPSMQAIVVMFFAVLLLAACGDDNKNAGGTVEDGEVVAIVDKMISGVSQKGPFVNGSSVTVQELDGETLAQTGNSYEGKIKNDMGEFSVKVAKLASQYALLKANGFYRNEVTGEKSKSQITLYALTDLSNRDEVNVNLLTHLAYERSLYLATVDTLSVAKAKKQAEAEIFKSFGIEENFAAAEDLNIFGADDQSAALLAVSILMQSDLSEGDFSERLADYAADIESDGIWNDAKTATEIADWASNRSLTGTLTAIRNNIAGWGLAADVPAFEKYVDRYWWQVYSLGFCNKDREGEVKAAENALSGNNGVHFICGDGAWRKATDIEKDTYEKKCDEDGKIVFGNVNKECPYDCDGNSWRKATEVEGVLGGCVESRFDEVAEALESHYICENRQWRKATDIEKDTYKWKPGKDGDVKNGDVVKTNCYVFEDSAWRIGNESDCSLELRGCTALRQDTVGLGGDDVWHICDANSWRKAKNIEKDTATWGAGAFDGEIRAGQINKTIYYVYETGNKSWRTATTLEKDTYDYTNNNGWLAGTDGEIKKGTITDTIYVFDATTWRVADGIEKTLGGCVATIQDSVGKVGNTYYICNPRNWIVATALQYDTYKRECTQDGKAFYGNVNTTIKYVCDNGVFRMLNNIENQADSACTSYNRNEYYVLPKYDGKNNYSYYKCSEEDWVFTTEKLNQGSMIDERDGHEYKTIGIGTQIWFAENLNYADSVNYPNMIGRNWCNEDRDSCLKYGRLYQWVATMNIDDRYEEEYAISILSFPHQGICPSGWHVPQRIEWQNLITFIRNHVTDNNEENIPIYLIEDEWRYSDDGKTRKGLNSFGMGILPFDGGSSARYHSADEHPTYGHGTVVFGFGISFYSYDVYGFLGKRSAFPVRCVKDEE